MRRRSNAKGCGNSSTTGTIAAVPGVWCLLIILRIWIWFVHEYIKQQIHAISIFDKKNKRRLIHLIFLNCPVLCRRHSNYFWKPSWEIIRIVESHIDRNLFDRLRSEIQKLAGFLHFHLYKIINGSVAGFFFKQTWKARRRIMILATEFIQGNIFIDILTHK